MKMKAVADVKMVRQRLQMARMKEERSGERAMHDLGWSFSSPWSFSFLVDEKGLVQKTKPSDLDRLKPFSQLDDDLDV